MYFSNLMYARFSRRVSIIPFVELYLDPCFSWDSVSSDSKVNKIYILCVILYNLWSWNRVWRSSSVGNVLLFVMWVLLSVMITAVSSVCLIASKILLWTLVAMIGSFFSWANIKGALGSKSVVLYRCSSCVFDAAVTNGIFDTKILSFMFFVVVWTLVFSLC